MSEKTEERDDDTPPVTADALHALAEAVVDHKVTKARGKRMTYGLLTLLLTNGLHCGASTSKLSNVDERLTRLEGKVDAVLELHAQQERELKNAHAKADRPPSGSTPVNVVSK